MLACGAPADRPIEAEVADYEALMEQARIPGLVVAVIESGQVVGEEILGVASAETGELVTEKTLFEAASLSKPVFATAILRMAERGELDLDQPLHELLTYERISHDPRSEQITARLVLSHRTGLPNWGPERLEFINDPATKFGYSGEGFVYLQRVVEKTTGESLDEIVRREVFEPLEMKQSRFSWPEDEEPPLAAPHNQAGETLPKRPALEANAAASLHTTAEEYARFVVAWLNGDLLGREATAEALTPVTFMEPGEGAMAEERVWRRLAWALGWGVQLEAPEGAEQEAGGPGDHLYFHWGDNGPFKAFVVVRPATGDGIVYFANSTHGLAIGPAMVEPVVGSMAVAFESLGYERVDALGFTERLEGAIAESEGRLADARTAYQASLEVSPDDDVTERRVAWLGELLALEEAPVEIPLETLERYVGTYGERKISLQDGELWYQRGGGTQYRLVPLSETLFAFDGMTEFRLEIALDDAGQPTKLVGHYIQGNTDESPRDPAS
jgi:CubicO group peptidase (beta-lactamase class C family)